MAEKHDFSNMFLNKVRGNHFDSWLDGHKNAEDKAVEFWNTRTPKERGEEK